MSNDNNELKEKVPHNLRYPISNLWDKVGSTDSPLVGLLINCSLAASGVAIMLLFSNALVSTAGAAWAILNLMGIMKWVFGL